MSAIPARVRRRSASGRLALAAAALAALLTPFFAEAQSGLRASGSGLALQEGDTARNPVRETERALAPECGPVRLRDDNIQKTDFTGDGRADYILRLAESCRGVAGYFCGSRGCRTDLWAAEGGRFRLVATLVAHSAEVIPWHDGRAVMFDRGPVWRWDGAELVLESRNRAGGSAGFPRDGDDRFGRDGFGRDDADRDGYGRRESVRDDGPSADLRDDELAARDPDDRAYDDRGSPLDSTPPPRGVWRVEEEIDGEVQAVVEELRSDGRLALRCGPAADTLELALWPSPNSRAELSSQPGAQHLVEFVVDGAPVETRMLVRRLGPDGPLTEPAIVQGDALVRALKRGSRLLLRNLGDNKPLAILRLSGSSASIADLTRACAAR